MFQRAISGLGPPRTWFMSQAYDAKYSSRESDVKGNYHRLCLGTIKHSSNKTENHGKKHQEGKKYWNFEHPNASSMSKTLTTRLVGLHGPRF